MNMSAKEKRAYRRRMRTWRLLRPFVLLWLRIRYGFRYDGSDRLVAIDGPMIVCLNHSNALDPLFTGAAFRRPLSFVASEHILRIRPWGSLINRYFCLIPHKKGSGRTGTSQECLKHIERGESIYLCAEGEQTWDGISGSAKSHTGSFVKKSGATLVTYRIEGAYLARPRWSRLDRRGKIRAYPVQIYKPEALAQMSEEEIEEVINRDLDFNVWEWQKTQPGGPAAFKSGKRETAAGLEKAVCTCPVCKSIGQLTAKEDMIRCSCGFSIRWSETGFFEPGEPFETIADWEAFDRERIAGFLRGKQDSWPTDEGVTLRLISEGHKDAPLMRGALTLAGGSRPVMTIGVHSFELDTLERMAMILDNRIVFTAKGHYYELRAENTNLRKYLTAWEILQEGK